MTLTTNGLNWLAQNAGSGNCFASSGISYTHADGESGIGGTRDVVTAFIVGASTHPTAIIIAGTSYNGFKAINDNIDLVYADVTEATDRQAAGGTYPQYCYIGTTVCTAGTKRCRDSNTVEQCRADGSGWDVVQTCGTGFTCVNGSCVATTPPIAGTTVGPFEFEFGEVCTGDPTAAIDVSGLKMWQETDTFRMNNFMVTNTSNCIAYFATQLKLWPLVNDVPSTCPTTDPEWSGVDRSTWTAGDPYIEVATIAPGETKEIWLDFFVPATTRGRKVLCMYLWANFSKWDLYDELAVIGES